MAAYYSRSIVVDHSKISADQVDFPLLISGTFSDLRYKGYGGHVSFTDGRDIAVYADASLTQLLDFELDKYVASSGQLVLWVRLPSLSASSAPSQPPTSGEGMRRTATRFVETADWQTVNCAIVSPNCFLLSR